MAIQIAVIMPNGQGVSKNADRYPDKCPLCHHAIDPRFIGARSPRDEFDRFDVAFQCPRVSCGKVFIGSYSTAHGGSTAEFARAAPVTPVGTKYGDEVIALSPTFVEIFNQAEAAEAANLHQLTGIGLRKALEFLVKDFAMHQSLDQSAEAKEKIKSTWLGTVIEQHVADATVKKAAKRAAWLGNDETHYLRKWEDKDITDLKTLIRLTVNAVENALVLARYTSDMPDKAGD